MDDMENNTEERHSLIVECPHCHTRVLPKANNICPACRNDMSDLEGVDPNQVSLSIHESEELPSFCYSCNMYTERYVRVSGDKESDLEALLFGRRAPEDTSNVIMNLPQCEQCGEIDEPEPVDVDYEHQKMTFVVHRGFRERVFQLRETQFDIDDMEDEDDV
jgi:hypothetical protein